MKKFLLLIIAAAMLAACSNEKQPEPEKAPEGQDGANVEEGLKADTPEYTYESFAQDDVSVNAKVKFTGKVVKAEEGRLEMQGSQEGDTLLVDDIRLGERTEITAGKEATVYGSYNGKDQDGIPVIKGIFIDAE